MKEKVLKIINNYGVIPQLKYLQTEMFEFSEAIIKHENKNPIVKLTDSLDAMACSVTNKKYKTSSIEHIEEEYADLMVMLEQFHAYYNLDDMHISEVMHQKIDRQLDRISKE